MKNPDNALMLYFLTLVCAFFLTPKWGAVRNAISSAGTAKIGTLNDTASGSPPPA